MDLSRILLTATAAAVAVLLAAGANAQLPFYTLPDHDFRWNWGSADTERQRGSPDIEISGTDSFFRCELTARLHVSSSRSPSEVRELENMLRTRLDFVYAVSETMYYMDQGREIDWATLDCKKNEGGPSSPEERAQRESEARDKMLRELERRRARAQRDSD
jgi:hypothetical protein